MVETKKWDVQLVDRKPCFYKRIEKGKTPVYLAHVLGKGDEFPLDFDFLRGDKAEHIDGFGYGVMIPLEVDETYMVGHSGEGWKQFFTVNSKGMLMELSRKQVYEQVGIEWQEEYVRPEGI